MRCAVQFRVIEHPCGASAVVCRLCGYREFGTPGDLMAWLLLHDCDEDGDAANPL